MAEPIVVECALSRRASAGAGCPLCIVRPGPLRAPRGTVDLKVLRPDWAALRRLISSLQWATRTAAVVIR